METRAGCFAGQEDLRRLFLAGLPAKQHLASAAWKALGWTWPGRTCSMSARESATTACSICIGTVGCTVEGRARFAKKLSERLGIEVAVVDFDREPERLEQFGRFDLVHCCGLLYHLSDPGRFLTSASRVGDCLLLETCVSFGGGLHLNRYREHGSIPSQALHGEGCRPTREWVFEELKRRYEYVYATRAQPRHPEFPIDWAEPATEGPQPKRAVFVASHRPICNPNLVTELPYEQARW